MAKKLARRSVEQRVFMGEGGGRDCVRKVRGGMGESRGKPRPTLAGAYEPLFKSQGLFKIKSQLFS